MHNKLRTFAWIIVGLGLAGRHSIAFSQAAHDMSWTQVSLPGMHLSLISPQKPSHSTDLKFSEKYVAIDTCDHHYCTGPLSVWKIEGNRLKIGYVTDEGYALIGVSAFRLVMRDKNGTVYTYAIAHP